MRGIVGIIFILLLSSQVFSQSIVKREGLSKMDQGYAAMLDGNYEEADELFRQAMGMLDKLPSDLAYYFGRNSYHIGKHRQAINWLTKYVQLKGTSGNHYDKAKMYLDRATLAFQEQREKQNDQTVKQLTNDNYYDCPGEIVICPACQGSGVLITPGKFGPLYQTCPISGLSGRMSCDKYNAYIRGELATKLE